MTRKLQVIVLPVVALILLAGCSGNKELFAQREMQISDLQGEIEQLKGRIAEEKSRADELHTDLEKALADLEEREKLLLEQKDRLSKITLPEAVTFASGSARLTGEGREILDRIWGVLGEYPDHRIMVEGHTDNVPIAEKYRYKYKSNWELSSARAHAVIHYLRMKHNADPDRLSAVGFGEYMPVADNGTEDGKARNRRVVIAVRAGE